MCVYICIELCICVSLSLHICICIVMEQQITPSTTPTTFQKKEFQKPISYPSLPEEIFFPLSYFHPLLKCIDVSIYLYMCVYVHILFLHYLQVQQLKVTLFFFLQKIPLKGFRSGVFNSIKYNILEGKQSFTLEVSLSLIYGAAFSDYVSPKHTLRYSLRSFEV